MKKSTKIIFAVITVIVWVFSMFIFVPYDMKTVELDNDSPNKFFDYKNNFFLEDVMNKKFAENADTVSDTLKNADYECLSAEESYKLLMYESNKTMNGYIVSDTVMGWMCKIEDKTVSGFVLFENGEKSYVLFLLNDGEKDFLRLMGTSYAVFSVDNFGEELEEYFFASNELISRPSSYVAIEAMLQSSAVTVLLVIVFVIITFVLTIVSLKKEKKSKKLSDDETTTDSDIKNYIKNKLGDSFFDSRLITSQPCITVDAKENRAVEFLCAVAERFGADEIFIGRFFEEKCFIDKESMNALCIREHLDENSYRGINYKQDETVIRWIIDGNNAEETAISFYIQELNILVYPARGKLYIFSNDSKTVYDKLITAVNPKEFIIQF